MLLSSHEIYEGLSGLTLFHEIFKDYIDWYCLRRYTIMILSDTFYEITKNGLVYDYLLISAKVKSSGSVS